MTIATSTTPSDPAKSAKARARKTRTATANIPPNEQVAAAPQPAEAAAAAASGGPKSRSRNSRRPQAITVVANSGSDGAAPRDEGAAVELPPIPTVAQQTEAVPDSAPLVRQSKKAKVLAMLSVPQGATIAELMAATGWQAHSVRAILTGFRKEGRPVVRVKDDTGPTRYRGEG